MLHLNQPPTQAIGWVDKVDADSSGTESLVGVQMCNHCCASDPGPSQSDDWNRKQKFAENSFCSWRLTLSESIAQQFLNTMCSLWPICLEPRERCPLFQIISRIYPLAPKGPFTYIALMVHDKISAHNLPFLSFTNTSNMDHFLAYNCSSLYRYF